MFPAILLVVLLCAVAAWVVLRPRNIVMVHSAVTGKSYAVKKGADAQVMADRLATMELKVRELLDRASSIMPQDPRIVTIQRKWNGTLAEAEASDEVAFCVDKSAIHVCLRNSQGTIEDLNTSMFVVIHELAHIATTSYDHTTEFWANMRFLLELAERLGVYTYENYDTSQTTFCGHPLGSSPLTCVKHGTCTSTLR